MTGRGLCKACNAPAVYLYTAHRGHPDSDRYEYRAGASCSEHRDEVRRWAASAGRVTERQVAPDNGPAQLALFG